MISIIKNHLIALIDMPLLDMINIILLPSMNNKMVEYTKEEVKE